MVFLKIKPEFPSNTVWKNFDVVKKEKQGSTSSKFQSMHIRSQWNEAYSFETLQGKRSRGQNNFGFQFQTFPWHINASKLQPKISNIATRNSLQ